MRLQHRRTHWCVAGGRSGGIWQPDCDVGIARAADTILKAPDVASRIELQLRKVVTFVEIFEDRREDFWNLRLERQLPSVTVVVLGAEEGLEVL